MIAKYNALPTKYTPSRCPYARYMIVLYCAENVCYTRRPTPLSSTAIPRTTRPSSERSSDIQHPNQHKNPSTHSLTISSERFPSMSTSDLDVLGRRLACADGPLRRGRKRFVRLRLRRRRWRGRRLGGVSFWMGRSWKMKIREVARGNEREGSPM